MSQFQQSQRVTSLFSNPSKCGGVYHSGKTQAAITIPAGARIMLVKNTKTASDRSEAWGFLNRPRPPR